MATLKLNKKLNNEVNRLIKNYNAKVARLQKLDKYNVKIIPEKISKKELIKDIVNNKELRIELNKLKRFTKRGSEELVTFKKTGETFAKYEIANFRAEKNRTIKNIQRKIKYYESTSAKNFGKDLNITFAQMADSNYLYLQDNLERIKNEKISELKRTDLNKKLTNYKRYNPESDKILRENYMKSFISMGYQSGMDPEKISKMQQILLEIPEKDFINLFNNDMGIKAIMNKYRVYGWNLSKGNSISNEFFDDTYELYESLYDNLQETYNEYMQGY